MTGIATPCTGNHREWTKNWRKLTVVCLQSIITINVEQCAQCSQFRLTNARSCHLIHSKIFKNIKLVHVSDLSGPSSKSTLIGVV